MSVDHDNPRLFGTEKDYAWDAWQKAFDGGGLLPDHARFTAWFDGIYMKLRTHTLRQRLQAAWSEGLQDRYAQGTARFAAWWQEIIDSQGVTT